MWCIVNLPNGTQQAVKWDPKAIGQECLEKVCKALGIICEMEYFGLEHWLPNQKETRPRQWINLRNRLTQDGSCSSGIQLMLALRVKFWVPVHFILQESVRNLFYMQAKVDLLEGRLNAKDWNNAAKLSALLCQADSIRFNDMSLKSKCPLRMKREQQEQLLKLIQQQHKEKKEKDYVFTLKKRRLSKQKSCENIDNPHHLVNNHHSNPHIAVGVHSIASTSSSSSPAISTPPPQSQLSNAATTSASSSSTLASSSSTSSAASASATTAPSSSSSSTSTTTTVSNNNSTDALSVENLMVTSPLKIYEDYIIRPANDTNGELPDEFLRQIAVEHEKLARLNMPPKSAKYWLLQEIQELPGYGEEIFSGVTTNENSVRCDIAVGAHGITVCTGDEKNNIPFSAIAAAKSFRRTFKLEYVDDHNDRKELEIKLQKHAIAAGLYRSITERHAFYVCDKVRGVVTNQFTRDLKGTIASMFKEDTELGKRYVFDIQRTCREVHDQARRILHERGIEITASASTSTADDISRLLPSGGKDGVIVGGKVDFAIKEKEEREAAIERCVDTRISEAMTCKICMDRSINSMFNPCRHVMACSQCAARLTNCPNCRVKITNVVKIFLPPELRANMLANNQTTGPDGTLINGISDDTINDEIAAPSASNSPTNSSGNAPISTPKITAAA